ncbi:MAG TPA: hypothetical protein VHX87_00650 [Galbitalea sp.]|jgi:hypothetical protein|nr:hypothetical protein [Galbitalea sp.]
MHDFGAVRVRFGRGEVTLDELVEGWASRVLKVRADMNERDSSGSAWGIDDLVGSYYLRQALQDGIAASPGVAVPRTLEAIDRLLESFTRDESLTPIRKIDAGIPDGWWWHRIPTRGPVRDEFDRLARAV